MKPVPRTQVDDRQTEFSLATALDCSGEPDMTRQEFRDEADVNLLLNRYGVNVPVQRTPQFGEADFNLDLHSAYIAIDRSQHAFTQLSTELREKYKTPHGMLDAMNSGQLRDDLIAERAARAKAERQAAKKAADAEAAEEAREARRQAAIKAADAADGASTPPEPSKGS